LRGVGQFEGGDTLSPKQRADIGRIAAAARSKKAMR
jgi:hypothetical protein